MVKQDVEASKAEKDIELEQMPEAQAVMSQDPAKTFGPTRTHYEPTTDEEKRLDKIINIKFDFVVVLVLAVDFLFQGIDKTNVGFAQASSNFIREAKLKQDDIADGLSLYTAAYVVFQPFSAMVGRRLGARVWLTIMLAVWGAISMAHAATASTKTFFALRFLLGFAEAGFVPTCFHYLSIIYPKEYRGFRMGMFTGMYAVAGAFSGLIAHGVLRIDSKKVKNWQVLFLLEGGLTVMMAFVSFILLPAKPGSAWFLTKEQQVHAAARVNIDEGLEPSHIEPTDLTKRDIIDAVRDWRKLIIVICNIFVVLPVTAFTTFLPFITKGMGYTGTDASLMSVPPFIAGFFGLLILMKISDKRRDRSAWLVIGEMIAMVGLIVMITSKSTKLRYAFTHICLAGAFIGGPIVAAWLAGNTPAEAPRSVILGINGWSNLAGVIAGQLFKQKYAPSYKFPLKVTLILIGVAVVGFLAVRLSYMLENKKRAKEVSSWTEVQFREEAAAEKRRGDQKRTYIYGY